MRTDILNSIGSISSATLGTFRVTDELPFDYDGSPLYQKNFKRIYVDVDQIDQSAVDDYLNGAGYIDEVTTIRVYFVTDAKKLPDNYESVVAAIKETRLVATITGVIERLCNVSTQYSADSLLTEFEFSFRKLLTNS